MVKKFGSDLLKKKVIFIFEFKIENWKTFLKKSESDNKEELFLNYFTRESSLKREGIVQLTSSLR